MIMALSGTTVITLTGTGVAGWTLSKSGNGRFRPTDYLDVSYCTVSQQDKFFVGPRSTDSGGNSNVYFREEPVTSFHAMVV